MLIYNYGNGFAKHHKGLPIKMMVCKAAAVIVNVIQYFDILGYFLGYNVDETSTNVPGRPEISSMRNISSINVIYYLFTNEIH